MIKILAKSSKEKGSKKIFINYLTLGSGSSGWKEYNLSDNFQEIDMLYVVPEKVKKGENVLMVRPDLKHGSSIDIQSILISNK